MNAIYKLGKVSKAALVECDGKHYDEIDHDRFMTIKKDDVDKNPKAYEDIRKLLSPIKLIDSRPDVNAIKRYHEISSEYNLVSFRVKGNHAQCLFSDSKNGTNINLFVGNLSRFFHETESDYYICKGSCLCNLSDQQLVIDAINNSYENQIEGNGFYWLSSKVIKKANKHMASKLYTNATNLYYCV